jgi:hypothetical protein
MHTPSAALPPQAAYNFCRMNLELAFNYFLQKYHLIFSFAKS